MPSEYKIRVIFTRDLNSDTTVAFAKWPDMELPEALKELATEDFKAFCEEYQGDFHIETVHIPNSIEEDAKNEELNTQYKVATALLEGNTGTVDEKKAAIELMLKINRQLNMSVDKITVRHAGQTFTMKESDYNKVIANIKENKPIEGIKILRDQTGRGLKECKDIFDEMKVKFTEETK